LPKSDLKLLRAGAGAYVSKPIMDGELVACVTKIIVSKRLFDQLYEQKTCMQEMAMMDHLTGLHIRH
jgi:PleD family two-component response regulator